MGNVWQLQEAKNRFSSIVDKAQHEGPQIVTKHGKESVVVISVEDYQKMKKPKTSLVKFLKESPLAGIPLDLKRDKTLPRDLEL
jgi:antitoxin Phd